MPECMFCQVVKGKVSSYKVYEDAHIIAFLDIQPVAKGHVLVVPKKHCTNIFDLDDEDAGALLVGARKVAHLLTSNLGAEGVNVLHAAGEAAQQSVSHFHFHVIPRKLKDGLDLWFSHGKKSKDDLTIVAREVRGE